MIRGLRVLYMRGKGFPKPPLFWAGFGGSVKMSSSFDGLYRILTRSRKHKTYRMF